MHFSTASRCQVHQLGRCSYQQAELLQAELLERRADGEDCDHLVVCEFEPVITVGRAGSGEQYEHLGIPVFEVPRGGKATFHGPGQLVIYPIIKMDEDARDLHAFLHALEQALIDCLAVFGLSCERDSRNTGCWANGHKLASIGVAVRRWVSYHGLALNISTDLEWFKRFDPCGLEPEIMSNMERELGARPDFAKVRKTLIAQLVEQLGLTQPD